MAESIKLCCLLTFMSDLFIHPLSVCVSLGQCAFDSCFVPVGLRVIAKRCLFAQFVPVIIRNSAIALSLYYRSATQHEA